MNFIEHYFTEERDPKKDPFVVVYAGRFQPFHVGHKQTYDNLVKKFGKENVVIASADNSKSKLKDPARQPFSFEEKKQIVNKMFDLDMTLIKSPYGPVEILSKMPDETAHIAAIGKKDIDRFANKNFFDEYSDDIKNLAPWITKKGEKNEYAGYYYVAPENDTMHNGEQISGSLVRKVLGQTVSQEFMDDIKDLKDEIQKERLEAEEERIKSEKESLFKSLYGKFDQKIFDLVTSGIQNANEAQSQKATRKKKVK